MKTTIKLLLASIFVAVLAAVGFGAGELDTSFKAGLGQLSGEVRATVIQADGKIIIAGIWDAIEDKPAPIIARLNSDGTPDPSFHPPVFAVCCGASLAINDMVLQPDGKILVGGSFLSVGGVAHQTIARLNSDGTLDTTFDFGAFSTNSGTVSDLELLPDGKVMAAGAMTYVGASRNSLVRFNSDGTVDPTFNAGSLNGCFAVKALPDGTYIGSCKAPNFVLKKFNIDGSADPSFLTSTTLPSTSGGFVRGIIPLPDNKFFIYGFFDHVNNTSIGSVARINSDGSLDLSFNPGGSGFGSGSSAGDVRDALMEPDGQLVLTGRVFNYNGTARDYVARINADGSLDTSLDYDSVFFSEVPARVLLQSDGKYVIVGTLTRNVVSDQNGKTGGYVRRVNNDGTTDNTFSLDYTEKAAENNAMAQQADGKILVGGRISINGRRFVNNMVRLNVDGTSDPTFNSPISPDRLANGILVLPDGKILVNVVQPGPLTSLLIRLNSDGSIDPGFTPQVGSSPVISTMALQSDGKILLGGVINNRLVVRINADGSADNTFENGTPVTSTPVLRIAPLANGKIIIVGGFTVVAGQTRGRIARLNANGSVDSTFNPPVGADGTITDLAIQPDGKIVIVGSFSNYNTNPRKFIARLTSEGALDPSLAAPDITGTATSFLASGINAVKLLPNGKLVIGGNFALIGGNPRRGVARLAADGSLDQTFNVGTGTDASVTNMLLQSNGRVLLGGSFTTYNGQPALGIARLRMNPSTAFDFDGDGKSDVSVYRPSDGNWFLTQSQAGFFVQQLGGQVGDIMAPADFDGDGRTDFAIYRSGQWSVISSGSGTLSQLNWGASGDIPVPGDYDGDGRADFIYYHPATQQWFRKNSLTGVTSVVQWGIPGDIPLNGDFDGDGKADPAIYRPSDGGWWYLGSTSGIAAWIWGIPGDIPAAADYDGDGKTDIAIFRPSDGGWYVINSHDFSVTVTGWGGVGDRPVAADYDGDGKADIAIYRLSTGNWFISRSTAGFALYQFGAANDVPVPTAYVP